MSRFLSAALCALFVMSFSLSDANAVTYNAAAGKAVYDASCASCHKDGIMGAPKTGNKPAWVSRIAQGMDLMVSHSVKGYQGKKGFMPAKGGNTKLTDAQVGNAVAYMVGLSK
ncbi:c-type cytochrome [Chlorobium phaeobacteroides]|uniref:Cytochrome c, class I n=1 Tax=Chlorobium phaeobacteroides (strain DSM 266 / SMG 266 / 2430) TaxID=290317 RepID=A1BJ75_CHLPD|nr:c-type cytochrome [Chlorobium phaeobacteroides]ABL66452.1 cytochrome c, class I [Chlorobium phaeobacteroides DSM 266]MBV5319520.1 cytochrome c5 family protein [Chlorobium phaeobacteroides]